MKTVFFFLLVAISITITAQPSSRCAYCPPSPLSQSGKVLSSNGSHFQWATPISGEIYDGNGITLSNDSVNLGGNIDRPTFLIAHNNPFAIVSDTVSYYAGMYIDSTNNNAGIFIGGAQITLDASSDIVGIRGDLLPQDNVAFDIGRVGNRWDSIVCQYLGTKSIYSDGDVIFDIVGGIGVGTNSAAGILDVNSGNNRLLFQQNDHFTVYGNGGDDQIYQDYVNHQLYIYCNDNSSYHQGNHVFEFNNGTMGIGTPASAYTLDVGGSTNISGTLDVSDNIIAANNIIPSSNSHGFIGTQSIHFLSAYIDTIHTSGGSVYIGSAHLTDSGWGSGKFLKSDGTDGNWSTVAKADVGLSNVDNTSDATKNSAAVTLTNKTINSASNTVTVTSSNVSDFATATKAQLSALSTYTTPALAQTGLGSGKPYILSTTIGIVSVLLLSITP